MSISMWKSWSDWGRLAASVAIGVTIDGIVPTTNHLESFNAILKWKHLLAWLHSGHCLHFDSLIHILITQILPGIFSHRQAYQEYSEWLMSRFQAHSGGDDLRNSHNTEKKNHTATACWWGPDESRDSQAQQLLQLQHFTITHGTDAHSYCAICASSKANIRNPNHVHYTIDIHHNGISSCSCPDFTQNNGLACKHLRMLRSLIQGWIGSRLEHEFIFPLTASLS